MFIRLVDIFYHRLQGKVVVKAVDFSRTLSKTTALPVADFFLSQFFSIRYNLNHSMVKSILNGKL